MGKVKLVAESLQEHTSKIDPIEIDPKLNEEQLNESSKGSLQKFMKNPEKNEKSFLAAYAAQFSKRGGDKLKNSVSKLDIETKKKLAQQSLNALEDSKKGYAWLTIKGGKIVGAGAMGVQSKSGIHKGSGVD